MGPAGERSAINPEKNRCCDARFMRPLPFLTPPRRCHVFEDRAEPEHHRAGAHQPQRLCELRELRGVYRLLLLPLLCFNQLRPHCQFNQAVRCYACASFAKTA